MSSSQVPASSGEATGGGLIRSPLIFVCTLLVLGAMVVAQLWLADRDQFLNVSQMQGRGIARGLPFLWHFAMWTDFWVISPLVALLVGRYWRAWLSPSVFLSA